MNELEVGQITEFRVGVWLKVVEGDLGSCKGCYFNRFSAWRSCSRPYWWSCCIPKFRSDHKKVIFKEVTP